MIGRIGGDRPAKLIDAGIALTGELSLPAVLKRIVDLASEVCGARYGALGVLTPDGKRIEEFITTGMGAAEAAKIPHPPVGKGILGALIQEAHAFRLEDIASDPRASGFPKGHPLMHTFVGVPVIARGTVFGNIYLTDKLESGGFTDEDEATLTILASQAGVAIENARLYEEALGARRDLERMAVMEDRERIAKELHDGAIQALFAVGMGLQGVSLTAEDPQARDRIETAVSEIDRVIRDLRNYIFGLRPGILADRQLEQAIRELADDLQSKSGVVVVADIDPGVAAALASRAGDLVQLVREALSNVGRHSGAVTCRISLQRTADGQAALVIDDDGTGFVQTTSVGNGMPNMQERAEQLGGTFQADSVVDEGTTIQISIPLG